MDKLEKINKDIEKINEQIDELIGEQFWVGKLANWYLDKSLKEIPKVVDYFKDLRDEVSEIPYEASDEVKDMFDNLGYKNKLEDLEVEKSSELSNDIEKHIEAARKQIEKSKETLKSTGEIVDSNLDDKEDPIFKDSNRSPYETARINFRGVNELSVQIGGNQEIKQKLAGTTDFDVVTIKKTSLGYIMRLHNNQFNDDVDLLLYAKYLKDKPQTNKIQLVYKRGEFVGSPKDVTFEIMRIR